MPWLLGLLLLLLLLVLLLVLLLLLLRRRRRGVKALRSRHNELSAEWQGPASGQKLMHANLGRRLPIAPIRRGHRGRGCLNVTGVAV